MPTKRTVLELVAEGRDYGAIGRELGIPAGQAYLIATGLPADGSDVPAPEDLDRAGYMAGSTQHLANPTLSIRKSEHQVGSWLERRATADSQMAEAGALRAPGQSSSEAESSKPADRDSDGADHESEPDDGSQDEGSQDEGSQEEGADERVDVLALLRSQHNEVHDLLKELDALPDANDATPRDRRRKEWAVALLVPRMAAHEAAEQEMFWPAVRDTIDDGVDLADRAETQERRVAAVLGDLDGTGADDERFDELVDELVGAVRRHVATEDIVFRGVEEELSEEQRRELGDTVRAIQERGPTRVHRLLSTDPAVLRVARPTIAAVDRARDRAGGRRRQANTGNAESRGKKGGS
ncbi:MAG TPA: hemerythrin domain-containing protein [Acidimicrobiales bacterium]|jgi:hypothetical protein